MRRLLRRMVKGNPSDLILGYVYEPASEQGLFADARPGDRITKPDRTPPYIIVNHTLEAVILTSWPGRLWQAKVLDPLVPQGHRGPYTRCFSVDVVDDSPLSALFGPHGANVVTVADAAAALDEAQVARLGAARHPRAGLVYSDGWKRWLNTPHDDQSYEGVLLSGGPNPGSPVGRAFCVISNTVGAFARDVAGQAAFDDDEDGTWLKAPWSTASSVLCEAAMALGAPSLFDAQESAILLAGWQSLDDDLGRDAL